jgi:adenylate cyclase
MGKVHGIADTYSYYLYWTPDYYWILFVAATTIIWAHGAIGLHLYLRQKKWYARWKGWLLGAVVALPIFALWGIYGARQDVKLLAQDPDWVSTLLAQSNPDRIDVYHLSEEWSTYYALAYILFVLIFFTVRKLVRIVKQRRSGVIIKYLEGTEVSVTRGTTLLEASLLAKLPHAHVCGGRGRCSTCRVQIIEGLEELPPPSDEERTLLQRVGSGSGVRLACQTRALASCTIYPLLLPNVTLSQSLWKAQNGSGTGIGRDVAILFADLRGFTALAEDKLPYDVVFLLNQYFQFMGHAVETHHGRIDKFIGDAIMAVFGTDREQNQACRDALAAARSMRFQLDRLNTQLKNELPEPLQIGFGIHCGHVIIGEMGYKDSHNLVAIGDATNTASRLESLTKDFNCELVVSRETIDCANLDFSGYGIHRVEIRGMQKPMEVYAVKDVTEIGI